MKVFGFSELPYEHITDEDLEQYDSGRLGFSYTFFAERLSGASHPDGYGDD